MLALAAGKQKPATVPWTKLGANPGAFLPQELIPEDVVFMNPSHMRAGHRRAAIRLWLEIGYLYVLQTASGFALEKAAEATVVPPAPAQAACILPGNAVNRYGSCGREVLLAMGVQLYEAGNDDINDAVMEDVLIDPAELERCEDADHNHFAPCVVPETSEARAQYCLTALQLVNDGKDRTQAITAIRSLVGLPVSGFAYMPRVPHTHAARAASCAACAAYLLVPLTWSCSPTRVMLRPRIRLKLTHPTSLLRNALHGAWNPR